MNKLQAKLCLLCVTLCWSTEVIIFACIPDSVPPFATTCITSSVGAIILFSCFFRRIRSAYTQGGRRMLWQSVLLGLINCTYNVMYIFGLSYFDVSSGAFTVCMTVVILPVVLLLIRRRIPLHTWLSVLLILAGIFVALSKTLTGEQLPGLAIIAVGSLLRAIFIIRLNEIAKTDDPVAVSAIIAASVGMISFLIWIGVQPLTFAAIPWNKQIIGALAVYAYFIIAFTQTLNVFAQKRTTPASVTIIYSMEIVFSVIWGAILPAGLVDPVALTPQTVAGVLLVVGGSLIELASVGDNKESEAAT
ncbi:MAG: DMT family transporter [Firmicutes bacterium]|nr:DMT family transporter [Bacillota bacterium]